MVHKGAECELADAFAGVLENQARILAFFSCQQIFDGKNLHVGKAVF